MTKVKRGSLVQTDFGTGPVVAITRDWLIHEDERGREICVYLPDNWVGIPAVIEGIDVKDTGLEIKNE